MTFREYLQRWRARFDARGDFARLAKADPELPEVASWAELRSYIEAKGTPPDVLEAGQHVWCDYQEALKRWTGVA